MPAQSAKTAGKKMCPPYKSTLSPSLNSLSNPFIANDAIEREYSSSTSSQHRKKFAQFFTPASVADLMAHWLLGNPTLKTVLEPAFGLGIFSRTLLQYKSDLIIKGFEIDSTIFSKATQLFSNHKNISILLNDYMNHDCKQKYDGIICNPPYFKFHDYDNKINIQQLEMLLNIKLNGFTNLYALFLLKSISQLNKNGRVAYIVPSEFLNSDYGTLVKAQLINSKTLRHIIVIHFDENVFDKALTTACILLLAHDNQSKVVQFTNIATISELIELEKFISAYPKPLTQSPCFHFKDLNPAIKWRAYYQPQNALHYKNLVPFSTYAKVMRGIATGANQFFSFNQSKAVQFGISTNNLLPCINKSIDVKQEFFTTTDFELLKNKDKAIFLFNAQNADTKAVQAYLTLGEEQGIHKKFLTASRKPWYKLENRPPAPIWVSVFNRTGLKFVRNEAGVSNLTTFHCIYPTANNLQKKNIDLLFAYLLTDIAKDIFADNRREYGNGLQKFEPNDINNAKMLDLNSLELIVKNEILRLYYLYRDSVLAHKTNPSLLNLINKILSELFVLS